MTTKGTSLLVAGLLIASAVTPATSATPSAQGAQQQSARCSPVRVAVLGQAGSTAPEPRRFPAAAANSGAYEALLTPQRMIPGDEYFVSVKVTNPTSRNLAKADHVLSYRWTLPDGTDYTKPGNRAETMLPGDLAPGQSVTFDAKVKAPIQTDFGNQRESFVLNWDLRNRTKGSWLSESDGVAVLSQAVTAEGPTSNQLGLEKFYQYDGTAAGSGWSAVVNQFSGNAVVGFNALSNPNRGLTAAVRLSYNSMDSSNSYVGPGWSLSTSTFPRLGSPLQFHVPLLTSPEYPAKITMVDGDGTTHLFKLNKNGTTDRTKWTYDSPAGVHLFLQRTGSSDSGRVWLMTRPDRTQIFYDGTGHQTAVADRNGNELRFHYERTNWGNRNTGVLTHVTDATDRQVLTLDYHHPGDDYFAFKGDVKVAGRALANTSIIHQLRSVTDVSGRKITFTYGENGQLREVVDGTDTKGQKPFVLFYDGSRLVRINDALGHGTQLRYAQHRVQQLVDRGGHATAFEYAAADSSGVLAKSTDAKGNSSTTLIDGYGRPVKLTNAKNQSTELAWDDDNNVRLLKEHNGAVSTWLYDKKTGYPLELKDAEAFVHGTAPTKLGYRTGLGGHVADLTEKTSPEGRRWAFGVDDKGNLKSITDPAGAVIRYDYDAVGQLTASTDANGHTTRFSDYDATGSPRRMVDPLDCTTTVQYDAVGNVVSTTDARQKTTTFTYDIFKRPLSTRAPKDAAKGEYITTPGPTFDQNDNVLASTAANGAVMTAQYDANGQLVALTSPKDDPTDTAVKRTTFQYDAVGNLIKQTQPKGNETTRTYDEMNRLVATIDAAGARATYEYDVVGNVVRAVDPRDNATKYQYDLNHRVTKVVDAASHDTERRYSRDGHVVATLDQDDNETQIVYDERGAVREVKVPHAPGVYRTTRYVYDAAGNRTKTITPRGTETADDPDDFVQEVVYDELGQVKEQLTPYDKDDERVRTPDRTLLSYDEVGRLTEVSAPASAGQSARNVTRNTYFDNGWIRSTTDSWDIRTSFDYDALGNQVSRRLESAGKTAARTMTWEYYPDGKLRSRGDDGVPVGQDTLVVDNSDPAVEITGDWGTAGPGQGHEGVDYRLHSAGAGNDRVTWNIDVPRDGTYEVFVRYTTSATATDADYTVEHDGGAAKKTVDQTQRQGDWVSLGRYGYTEDVIKKITLPDKANGTVVADAVRLVRDNSAEVDNEQKKFGYVYDANDNMTLMTDGSPGAVVDNYVVAYTPLNQVAEIQEKLAGAVKKTTRYTYDPVGNPVTRTHDAQSAVYEYNDPRNLLTKVTNTDTSGTPQVTAYSYNRRGLRASETKPNGNIVSNDEYFLDGLTRHELEKKPDGTVVSEHRLEYDANGQRVKDTSKKMNADNHSAHLDQVHSYSFDPRDRLRGVTKSAGPAESYVHDANNNVIEQNVDGKTTTFRYDRNRLLTSKLDQVTSTHTYDPYGRLDKVTAAGKLVEKYRYDGFDRVLEQQKLKPGSASERVTIRNSYDPMDRTTTRTEGDERTDFSYLGLSREVLTEVLDGKLQKSYQYSPTGERLAQTKHNDDGTEETAFYGYNAHTDVEQVTDAAGNTKATYGYSAYGGDDKDAFTGVDKPDPQNPTKDLYNAYRFNAKRFDQDTGNYDMGFRDYSPGRNTFLSRDSYNGALADLQLGLDPWSGNRYAFTGGNPISRVEVDGHCAVDEGALVGCATLRGEARAEREQELSAQNQARVQERAREDAHDALYAVPPPGSPLRLPPGAPAPPSGPRINMLPGLAGVLGVLGLLLASDSPQGESSGGPNIKAKEQEERCREGTHQPGVVAQIHYFNLDQMGRATGAQACLKGAVLQKDDSVRYTPPGYKEGMDRGHLVARDFGGSNVKPENFVPLHVTANQTTMKAVEEEVARRLNRGERVYYLVRTYYYDHPNNKEPYVPTHLGIYVGSRSGSGWYWIPNK